MTDLSNEKQHLKKLGTFTFLTLAILFSGLFLLNGLFILSISFTGILDFPYFASMFGISCFVLAVLFSVLAFKNIFAKILLAMNLLLMLYLIWLEL